MDYDELFPNRFLKAGLFKGKDYTLTIKDVKTEELEGSKGKQIKAIVIFEETPKHLVLNKTNGECVKAMFGRNTAAWIGKKVTFWPREIEDSFTGEMIQAIRVRGSPDIEATKTFAAQIGRKSATLKVEKTGAPKKGAAVAAVPAAHPEPTAEEKAEILAAEAAGGAA